MHRPIVCSFPGLVRLIAGLLLGLLCAASGAPAAAVQPLATAVAAQREVDVTWVSDAAIEAVRQSTVAAQISGRVVEILYDVGDRVQKGQVIVRIDEREATQVLAGSQAQVAQAQAILENARAQLERSRQLAVQRFISAAALDKAQADYNAAAAAFQVAVAGAGQAATAKGFATVVAPYGGIVSARHVELGEMASPGKPLMTGFDPAQMRAVATVPEHRLPQLRAATHAMVEIPTLERWIRAEAVNVLPLTEPKTHATQVRVTLPPNESGLLPGLFARVHFVVGRANRLVVPAKAVVRRSELIAVYVVGADGAPRLRQVRVGETLGRNEVEILAGLSAGESVALDPVRAGMTAGAAAAPAARQ